jgi:hypothetical protein
MVDLYKFPDRLRIGAHDYTVEDWPSTKAATSRRFGECRKNEKIIRVDRQWGPRTSAETLLREIMHACYCEYCIDGGDDEDRTVSALSSALAAVWRGNPNVFLWISRALVNDE